MKASNLVRCGVFLLLAAMVCGGLGKGGSRVVH